MKAIYSVTELTMHIKNLLEEKYKGGSDLFQQKLPLYFRKS